VDLQYYIDTVTAIADRVRDKRGSKKTINLSFDEWNVWYIDEHIARMEAERDPRDWPVAPRLLEDIYTVADAVTFGSLLITLLKNCDRVTSASLAQLVNVIAPIMTEPGGPAWRQTTFFPFATTARLARGTAYRPSITTSKYETKLYGDADHIDSVITYADEDGTGAVFLVNRDQSDAHRVSVDLRAFAASTVTEAAVLADEDSYAVNTLAHPERVTPEVLKTATIEDGRLTAVLPPLSWSAIAFR